MASIVSNNIDTSAVPGTVLLVDVEFSLGRKHAKDHADIVLVPTPSADPEDPLNWTPRRKLLSIACMVVYCISTGIAVSAPNSVIVPLAISTGISVSDLISGTGYVFLVAGWGCLIWQPVALQYGKRLSYLITMLGSLAANTWAPSVSTNAMWIAKNVLTGLFGAVLESLPEATVTDLYFTHQRGAYMGIYALSLQAGNCIGPIISGFIYDGAGYPWVFYVPSIICGASFLFLFFFMEETNYDRKTVGVVISNSQQITEKTEGSDNEKTEGSLKTSSGDVEGASSNVAIAESYPVKTYWQKLSLLDKPRPFMIFAMIWHQLKFVTWPVVLYSGWAYGISVVWSIVLGATSSLFLSAAPYNFSGSQVGLCYFAPLIGNILGAYFGGWFSDVLTIRLVRRNNGVFEPEMRLWLLAGAMILLPCSLILWGVGAANGIHWFGILFGWGMMQFANTATIPITVNYMVDSYKDQSGDALVSMMLIRNSMGFAFTYAIEPWIEGMGIQNTFISCAFISMVMTGTFLIMIKWGKKFRENSRERYWKLLQKSMDSGMAH